jgi:hypothetical protein
LWVASQDQIPDLQELARLISHHSIGNQVGLIALLDEWMFWSLIESMDGTYRRVVSPTWFPIGLCLISRAGCNAMHMQIRSKILKILVYKN